MYEIDPDRVELAREFRDQPFGPHSAELEMVLHRMRRGSFRGRHLLLLTDLDEYTLAESSGVRGEPPRLLEGQVFSDPEEAEWAVFKIRWQRLTGQELELD